MNREDIIRMAREAWLSEKEAQLITEFDEAYISCTYLQDLEKFAALVASAEREVSVNALRTLNETYEIELRKAIATEREACAKVCETIGNTQANMNETWRNGCRDAATEIRARGQA